MTIKLRPETLKALEPEIVKVFELTKVTSGSLLDISSSFSLLWNAENLLPKNGPIRQQLNQYIGEHSLVTLSLTRAQARAQTKKYDPEKESQPLLAALGVIDPLPLAELLDAFQSLPRSYWATLLLPASLSEFVTLLPPIQWFGSSVRLIHEPELMKLVAPTKMSGALAQFLFSGHSVNIPNNSRAALQVEVEGFVPRFGSGETVDEAHGLFKCFFGLGLAVGLFKAADLPKTQSSRLGIQFHLGEPKGGEPVSTIPLTDAETTATAGLSYDGRTSPDHPGQTGALDKLTKMGIIFSSPEQHQLLLEASRWLFNSYVSEDPLLSFVQATVVLGIVPETRLLLTRLGLRRFWQTGAPT